MHRQGERLDLPPSWFLTDWLSRLPRVGTALDIACGSIVHFEESVGKDPDRPERTVALQRLVACNGHPGF
jgi:hypothetical protein